MKKMLFLVLLMFVVVVPSFAQEFDRSADLNTHGYGKNYNTELAPWFEVQGPKMGNGGTRYTETLNPEIRVGLAAVAEFFTHVEGPQVGDGGTRYSNK